MRLLPQLVLPADFKYCEIRAYDITAVRNGGDPKILFLAEKLELCHTNCFCEMMITTSDNSSGMYDYSKELLPLISKLYQIGFSGDLSLPSIVMLGNQSTGKSSIVESRSIIKFAAWS